MKTHQLDAETVHYEWNNAIAPRLEIEPGDTVVFETRDAADRYYSRASTHADVLARGPFRGHPLTGPVRVRGARPGAACCPRRTSRSRICRSGISPTAPTRVRASASRCRSIPSPA